MGIGGSKDKDATPPGGAATRPTQSPEQHRFEDVALGKIVDPLASHAVAQPLPPQARCSGQTRRLFGPEPMPQQRRQLALGRIREIEFDGYFTSSWVIDNLHHASPLVGGLRAHLDRQSETKVTIERRAGLDDVEVLADMHAVALERCVKVHLLDFCGFVRDLRDNGIDDDCIAFLAADGVEVSPSGASCMYLLASEIGTTGLCNLIKKGFHETASILFREMPDFISVERGAIKSLFENLYENLTRNDIGPQKFGISPTYDFDRHFTNLKALLCMDLCTGPTPDPVQAGRIVVRYLTEAGKPLPYQDVVMSCLLAMIETPEQASRAVRALAGDAAPASPPVAAWMAPLLERSAASGDTAAF